MLMVVPTLSRLGDRVYIPLYPCNNSSPYLIFLSQNSNMSRPPPPNPLPQCITKDNFECLKASKKVSKILTYILHINPCSFCCLGLFYHSSCFVTSHSCFSVPLLCSPGEIIAILIISNCKLPFPHIIREFKRMHIR